MEGDCEDRIGNKYYLNKLNRSYLFKGQRKNLVILRIYDREMSNVIYDGWKYKFLGFKRQVEKIMKDVDS